MAMYKVIQSKAFRYYVNSCRMALIPLTTTDVVELINLDFPNLDIKKVEYGYDEVS